MNKTNPRVSETRFSLLEQKVGNLETGFNELRSELRAWMTTRTRSPWQFIALLLAILVPLGWIFNVYITSAISPVNATAVQASANANSNTITLTRFAELVSKLTADFAEANAERKSNEREVETQVDAMAQSFNMALAESFRWSANNQNALHDMGAKMPSAPTAPFYFPNISNRNHRETKSQ